MLASCPYGPALKIVLTVHLQGAFTEKQPEGTVEEHSFKSLVHFLALHGSPGPTKAKATLRRVVTRAFQWFCIFRNKCSLNTQYFQRRRA